MLTLRFSSVVIAGALASLVVVAPDTHGAAALPNSAVASNYFFTVHSNATSSVWVAPPTWRVMRDTAQPTAGAQAIDLSAARNEFEPVQIVTRSTTAGSRSLNIGAT